VEEVLSKDIATVGKYFQTWKLKLSATKTVSAVLHLNNKEAKRELKVNFDDETLAFCSDPRYLGITWYSTGRSRIANTFSHFAKKLASRVALLRRRSG